MTKKQYNIMTGLIIWAGLLIVVLYSPIGSPDLYYSQNYYTETPSFTNQSVIPNAPKQNYASGSSDVELDIPDISSHLKTNYHVGSYPSGSKTYHGSSYSIQTPSFQNNSSSGYSTFGSSGGSFTSTGRSSGNKGGTPGISMTNGITTMYTSTDLINSPTKQSVNYPYSPESGATDPGGDPTGDPIPAGDGWGLLLIFGVCYAAFKKRYSIKKHFFFHTHAKRI